MKRLVLTGLCLFAWVASESVRAQESKPAERAKTRSGPQGDRPASEVADFGSFKFKPDPAWTARAVSSSMRKAHFILPPPAEEIEAAELIVYHFGPGQGGVAEKNVERWKNQFKKPEDRTPDEFAKRKSLIVDGLKVTVLEVRGTYLGASFGPRQEPKPDHMMFAAIVETDGGFHYLKTTGPEKTLEHWRKQWFEMISGIEAKKSAS